MTDPIPPDVLDEGARLVERLVIGEYDQADLAVSWFRHEGPALLAVARDHARMAEQVRQMGLHSLGCSGKVGTDGVECEWPDEGPCLVASLRAEIEHLRGSQ